MFRRQLLGSVAAVATAGLAGCTGDGTGGTPTDEQPTASRTGPNDGGVITYLVRNDDDETYSLDVMIENRAGDVVHRKSDAEFNPGEQLGATSRGHDPTESPYPITVSLPSLATTLELKLDECPEYDLLFAVTSDGRIDVEREACIT